MTRRIFLLLMLIAIPFVAGSHIGSPGVSFEGKAGPYDVMVLVNPPEVIPGTASVDIFTHASGITSIWAKPEYWFAGDEGTPEADEMLPVPNEPGHYRGLIWLMDAGTSGIEIEVKGGTDNGKILVPVMAISTRQKTMDPSLGWILAGLCAFLVILMVTIISASVSDGLVKPNAPETININRRRWIGSVISTIFLLAILWGGKSWWENWAKGYKRFMYTPFKATTTTSGHELIFTVDTTRLSNLTFTRNLSYIIPDHGKLMHMFLVREGSMDVFAHLHPMRKDSLTFVSPLPALPRGKYLVFADVTRLSGFSETIPDTFEITDPATSTSKDSLRLGPDDTYFFTNPVSRATPSPQAGADVVICGKPGIRTTLSDSSTITWEYDASKPLVSGTLYSLKFGLQDETGKPAILQPYLGMTGHAVVMKDDGSVYIHLHPVGSYSVASQEAMITRFENEEGPFDFDKRPRSVVFMDSIDRAVRHLELMTEEERNKVLMANMSHEQFDPEHPDHSIVSFPYAFPTPGRYRIWIQMKRNGKILNSAFDAQVD